MYGKIKTYHHWIFLEIEHEIGRYYRKLLLQSYLIKLQRPSNAEHITVVSEYDGVVISDFRHLDDTICEWEVEPILYTNQNAFWLNVISQDIDKIRELIGLAAPTYPLHFCIGYLSENISTDTN